MKPKIFVSSTIIDFEDLRGALKYYLEEYGYDVQMSEYPNFNVDSDDSAIDTCIKNLMDCQYFILLIGYRRGSWYKENEISVTNFEYRSAKSLIEGGHPLRIISFVRKPIWILKNDRNGLINHFKEKSEEYSNLVKETGSIIIDDPNYIFNFLQEISNGIKFPGNDSPVNNWITEFNQFEDIVTALKNTFHISESLPEKRLKRLLKNELIENKNKFLLSADGIDIKHYLGPYKFPQKHLMEYLAVTFYPKLFNKKNEPLFIDNKGITIPQLDATRLTLIYTMVLPQLSFKGMNTRFLEKAIDEGIFLSYNVNKDDYDINLLSLSFTKLLEFINILKNIFNTDFYKVFEKEMAKISTDSSLHEQFVHMSVESAGVILSLVRGIRIYELIDTILEVLENNNLQSLSTFDFSEKYFLKYL